MSPVRELLQADERKQERLLLHYMAAAANLQRENGQLRERQSWLEQRVFDLEKERA